MTNPVLSRAWLGGGVAVAAMMMVAMPAVAASGEAGQDRMNMVIVFGDEACPVSTGNEITVCARKAESERYRIPAPFREQPSTKSEAWTTRVLAYESVGAAGAQSCSPVGAGGWTGCASKFFRDGAAEKKAGTDVQFGKLIEEARAKRMATTDADAKQTQADVEAAEKAYDARQRAKQDPTGGDAVVTAPTGPTAKPGGQ